tara:strand:+ start:278 stop:1129 length:852 start_codon:yes stop_codon:yes gene_type:complete
LGHRQARNHYYKKNPQPRSTKWVRYGAFGIKAAAGIGMLLLISYTFILAHDMITQSDFFRAKNISVQGNYRLSDSEILRQAQVNTESNILSVNLQVTRKRLLAHPWIAEAEIRRELPDAMAIKITEHKSLAIVDLGRKFIVSTRGEIFKTWSPMDDDTLPVINGLEFFDFDAPGKPRSMPFGAVMEVFQLGSKLNSILPTRFINRVFVDREIGITICAFEKNQTIKLGFHDYPEKYERLEEILIQMKNLKDIKDFDSIDLNSLERIVVSPIRIKSSAKDNKEV